MYEQTNKQIRLPVKIKKTNYCSTCVFFIHDPCLLMCILLYASFFFWIHVYAVAILSMVHCGSAVEPGASGLPYENSREKMAEMDFSDG